MTDIIPINELAKLRRQVSEQAAEIERLKGELQDAKTEMNRADGLNALLRLQFHDLLSTVGYWKESLGRVEMNILEMKAKIPPEA